MIKIPYRGIIEITGDHDVGKTIAALQTSNNMKDIVFVDDDVKGDGTVRQMAEASMEFDLYIDLSKERAKIGKVPTPDELLQYVVLPAVEKITEKHRKIIIWDTWRIVYQACRGHVERNQAKYNSVVTWRGTSTMIQGLISKVARMLEAKILNELKASCDLLIITHHIKDNYVANVLVGKIPESSATFNEVCNMRLWLRRNPRSKVPIILFLKRPNLPKMVGGELRFINIVPLKITPTDKHESIWKAIAEYEDYPIESRPPNEDETPTPEELSAISGTLTQEQQSYVKTMIEYQKAMAEELQELAVDQSDDTPSAPEQRKDSKAVIASDAPQNGLQLISRAKADLNMSLDDIQKIIGKSFAQINESFDGNYWKTLVDKHDKDIAATATPKKKTVAKK